MEYYTAANTNGIELQAATWKVLKSNNERRKQILEATISRENFYKPQIKPK